MRQSWKVYIEMGVGASYVNILHKTLGFCQKDFMRLFCINELFNLKKDKRSSFILIILYQYLIEIIIEEIYIYIYYETCGFWYG